MTEEMNRDPLDRGSVPRLRIRDAGRDEMRTVLRASHSVWGEGTTPDDYISYNLTLKESPWGAERYRFIIASIAGDSIVAALKLYSLEGELHGGAVRIAGVGALFTMPEHRGRGVGAALLVAALRQARDENFEVALLLSDISAEFYTRLGFIALPGGEASCVTTLPAPWPGEPAWVRDTDRSAGRPGVRSAGPADVEALGRLHQSSDSGVPFRMTRDRQAWEQLFLTAEAGSRLRHDGETTIWMIDDHEGPAAYAVLRDRRGALRWLEHGARQGRDRCLDDLFWAAITRARREGLTRLEGWSLPSGAVGETLYPIARRRRLRPLLMARSLDPRVTLSGLRAETDCRISELERF